MAIEQIPTSEELDIENIFASKNPVYTLRVRGDSLIDDQICDGDYVVIERRSAAKNGEA